MFDLKFNIINAARVILSALSFFLMLRVFGVSQGADIYLLAVSIITSWQYIPLLFTGQFIPFYNDLKVKSIDRAHAFFYQALIFALLLGVLLFLIFLVFLKPLVHLYTVNLDAERHTALLQILSIMISALILLPAEIITENLFIAEKKFVHAYILNIITLLIPTAAMGYMFFAGIQDIRLLASAYAAAYFLAAFFGIFVCLYKYIPFKLSFEPEFFKKFISNSFTMSFGTAPDVFLMPVILNNFLSSFSSGIISNFYYARNAVLSVSLIAADYANKDLTSDLSNFIARRNKKNIIMTIKKYLIFIPLIFSIAAVITYYALPFVLKVIFYNSNTQLDINEFARMFIFLIPWYIIALISYPFYDFNTLSKKSGVILFANIIQTSAAALILNLFLKNAYNIAAALFAAQFLFCTVHLFFTVREVKKLGKL